ncbi:hypothetical protein ACF07B_34050 [Streptomyces sp. NPDC015532]|uniref:hypothetical protein n=1 Tax=Streptomyces sp. NPDC015532 TaxID=3364960 RepID=UPI0036F85810
MPEHLKRRMGGVDGTRSRLIAGGAQEAMDSGGKRIEESLIDEIVISRKAPADEIVTEASAPARAALTKGTRSAKPGRKRPGGNPTLGDTGPNAAGLHG